MCLTKQTKGLKFFLEFFISEKTVEKKYRRVRAVKSIPNGIYAMLTTPLNYKEDVDIDKLVQLVHWCADQGARGIVVTPSIGEFACMTPEERYMCYDVCAEAGKERNLFLVAGVADTCARFVYRHIDAAQEYGYHAAQLNPPYYWIPDREEVLNFYSSASRRGMSLIVYNNPMLSKIDLTPSIMSHISNLGNVIGIKEVKTDRQIRLEPLFEVIRNNAKIFTTFRAFTTGLTLGSSGGFINIFALPFCVAMWEKWNATMSTKQRMRIEEVQTMLNHVFPRGGEDNKKHIGTTKLASSIVSGISMGNPYSPYLLPGKEFSEQLRKKLPVLQQMVNNL